MKIFSTRNGDTNRTLETYGNAKLLQLDQVNKADRTEVDVVSLYS
jgi:hypothetical protein